MVKPLYKRNNKLKNASSERKNISALQRDKNKLLKNIRALQETIARRKRGINIAFHNGKKVMLKEITKDWLEGKEINDFIDDTYSRGYTDGKMKAIKKGDSK